MARILTVAPGQGRGIRRLFLRITARLSGGVVPGVFQILLPDLQVTAASMWLVGHLHMRKSSPMTPLQREMVAVVVNGAVSGAP